MPLSSLLLQVPLWSVDDVASWVKRIGFDPAAFLAAGVDGDLLLQLDEANLKADLGFLNGIHRKRFVRELQALKRNADYSSVDRSGLAGFLANNVGGEYRAYAYAFLRNDLTLDLLQRLSDLDLEDMLKEIGVTSSIHRRKIAEAVLAEAGSSSVPRSVTASSRSSSASSLVQSPFTSEAVDVYVSYPRANHGAAELASLVKMQLQLRGLSVYADDAAPTSASDMAALSYVREARTFVLVLPPNGLDECIGDLRGQSRLHREITTALQSNCNVVPVLQDFVFPEPESLPENMRGVCYYNGVRWIHDYQDACIDKLERFIRGESLVRTEPTTPQMGRLASSRAQSRADSGRSTPTRHAYVSSSYTPASPLCGRRERTRTFSVDSAIGSAASNP